MVSNRHLVLRAPYNRMFSLVDKPPFLQLAELPPYESVISGIKVCRDEAPSPVYARAKLPKILFCRRDKNINPMLNVREFFYFILSEPKRLKDCNLLWLVLLHPLRRRPYRSSGAVPSLREQYIIP